MRNCIKINIILYQKNGKKTSILSLLSASSTCVYRIVPMSIFENETRIRVGVICTTKYYTISGFGFLRATQIGPPPRTRTRPA